MSQADISAQVARLHTDDLIAQARGRALARQARWERSGRSVRGTRRVLGLRFAR